MKKKKKKLKWYTKHQNCPKLYVARVYFWLEICAALGFISSDRDYDEIENILVWGGRRGK